MNDRRSAIGTVGVPWQTRSMTDARKLVTVTCAQHPELDGRYEVVEERPDGRVVIRPVSDESAAGDGSASSR